VLVPPLYSASDAVLQGLSDYVKGGGRVVMSFKSGFTNEHSTVRDLVAPGPLRAAAGFRYQDFTSLPEPVRLTPDPFRLTAKNTGSVWAEFIEPETAEVVMSYDHPVWRFPAVTRNRHGAGWLTYEGTFLSAELQREIIRAELKGAGLAGPDMELPEAVRVRHGRNARGKLLHYYLNFSGAVQKFLYPYAAGTDLLTGAATPRGKTVTLTPWDVAIVAEQ